MSEAVEQAEAALRAFDDYWGDGGPVDAAYGRPFELIRALLAYMRTDSAVSVSSGAACQHVTETTNYEIQRQP